MTCIPEVLGSNLGRNIHYSDRDFSQLSSALQANVGGVFCIKL
jgi:hypothetical protein